MASRVGAFDNRTFTADEHHEWAAKLWQRMDRDGSGSITKEELNCDEFQDVLKSVIAPTNTGAESRATYGRSEMHIQQALDFCLRKATLNKDGTLSFKEFKSFMRILRNSGDASNRVNLIFALFDLDGSETIDKEEFVGIWSFFCGKRPTRDDVKTAFLQMDKFDKGEVTRKQFINWLKTDAPEDFKQHAAGVEADAKSSSSSGSAKKPVLKVKKIHRPAPGMWHPRPDNIPTWTTSWHSFWNNNFRGRDHTLMNPTLRPTMKHYFSAPQTLPELERFYKTYSGFDRHLTSLKSSDPPVPLRAEPHNLSTASKQMEVNPERALPGGTAKTSKGDPILWDNDWPDKAWELQKAKKPGSLLLRCPGKPPPLLYLGRDADHILYRQSVERDLRMKRQGSEAALRALESF
jgi:Ca2+-binding EF-hand superfamily protein